MKKLFYPAIFHRAEEGGFWVSFPDTPECLTEGETMEEAYNMAVEVLELELTERIKEGEELPSISNIRETNEDEVIVMVPFNSFGREFSVTCLRDESPFLF